MVYNKKTIIGPDVSLNHDTENTVIAPEGEKYFNYGFKNTSKLSAKMNATLVMDVDSKETIFFDPGDEIDKIINAANEEGMVITSL